MDDGSAFVLPLANFPWRLSGFLGKLRHRYQAFPASCGTGITDQSVWPLDRRSAAGAWQVLGQDLTVFYPDYLCT